MISQKCAAFIAIYCTLWIFQFLNNRTTLIITFFFTMQWLTPSYARSDDTFYETFSHHLSTRINLDRRINHRCQLNHLPQQPHAHIVELLKNSPTYLPKNKLRTTKIMTNAATIKCNNVGNSVVNNMTYNQPCFIHSVSPVCKAQNSLCKSSTNALPLVT